MQSSGRHIQETVPQGWDVPSLPAPSCLLPCLQPEQAEPEQTQGCFPLITQSWSFKRGMGKGGQSLNLKNLNQMMFRSELRLKQVEVGDRDVTSQAAHQQHSSSMDPAHKEQQEMSGADSWSRGSGFACKSSMVSVVLWTLAHGKVNLSAWDGFCRSSSQREGSRNKPWSQGHLCCILDKI